MEINYIDSERRVVTKVMTVFVVEQYFFDTCGDLDPYNTEYVFATKNFAESKRVRNRILKDVKTSGVRTHRYNYSFDEYGNKIGHQLLESDCGDDYFCEAFDPDYQETSGNSYLDHLGSDIWSFTGTRGTRYCKI